MPQLRQYKKATNAFAVLLRQFREQNGVSYRRLSIETTVTDLTRYERGMSFPNLQSFKAIVRYMGLTPQQVYDVIMALPNGERRAQRLRRVQFVRRRAA
jgi:hypothetical protein